MGNQLFRAGCLLLATFCCVPTVEGASHPSPPGSRLKHLKKKQPDLYAADQEFVKRYGPGQLDEAPLAAIRSFCLPEELQGKNGTVGKFYDVYQHRGAPIYFVRFKSKRYQDLAFDRISDFVEQDGMKLVDPDQHEYPLDDGNDLKSDDIAAYFNAMRRKGFQLTAFETRLRAVLLKSGNFSLLKNGRLQANKPFVVLSSAVDSSEGTAAHEFSHAVYFTDPAYREKIKNIYIGLSRLDQSLAGKILEDIGGHTPQKGLETFYTEFGAYFRDPATLYRDGENYHEFSAADRTLVDGVAAKIREVEAETRIFKDCSEGACRPGSRGCQEGAPDFSGDASAQAVGAE